MGDAVADGEVKPADPEETIDGAEPRQDPVRSVPVEVLAVVRDYPELLEVERRHYVVVRELARGGMGRVLEARDLRLGRQVAIKELLPKNRDIARRFEREARITARLQHPSIIHVYEAGVWQGGEPFYAMPIVPGRSLDKLVAEKKTFAERLALLPRVIAVADALAYAHDKNVIHRDLKPANVLVGEFGETVVIDWGLAKDLGVQTDAKESMALSLRATGEETVSGSVVGTPAYMPPEQARGGDGVDQRADVYSLGALLYKVLAGVAPYQGETALEVIAQVKAQAPVPLGEREPEAPPDLLAIVAKAMSRKPDDRYVTASELAQDLKLFETGQLVGAHRYTAGQLVRRWLRRHRIAVGVSLVAVVTLAVVGVVAVRNVVEARDRAEVRRVAQLEEQGRGELADGHAGVALAYLAAAERDGTPSRVRRFLIADAMRSFLAEKRPVLARGAGIASALASPDGTHIATLTGGTLALWSPDGKGDRVLADGVPPSVLAFDATSSQIAAGGVDGTLRVWGLDGAHFELSAHTSAIRDVAFAPDGRVVTAGADGRARVWTLETGAAIDAPCDSHGQALLTARFDHLGTNVVSAGDDAEACVWDSRTREQKVRLRGHKGPITVARWGPDDTWVATASEDGTARVWSAKLGKPIVAAMVHPHAVDVLEISRDGRLVVTGERDGAVRIWQLPARLPDGLDSTVAPARGGAKLGGHSGAVTALAFAANDDMVATAGTDSLAMLWEVPTGQKVATLEQADEVTAISFAGGDHWLVTASRDGTARLWDTTIVKPFTYRVDSPVHALAVSSTGVVAAARDDTAISLMGRDEHELRGVHHESVLAVAFTPDGSTLISAGEDENLVAWDVAKRVKRLSFEVKPGSIHGIAVAPDGDRFVTVGDDLLQWSLRGGAPSPLDAGGVRIDAIAYAPAGDLLVGVDGTGTLVAWRGDGAHRDSLTLKMKVTTALAFSDDGRALAVGGDGEVQIYAVTAGRISSTPTTVIREAVGEVRALAFACGGDCLVSGSREGTAEVWGTANGKRLGTRDPHAGPISGLAVADHGSALWIATEGKTVGKWDIHVETRSVEELHRFITDHVPWRLGRDDVVIRIEGGSDDQRGSDRK